MSLLKLQDHPSPEPSVELCPRLCHLVKGENGYGFNLHSDKKKGGQFVRSVDPGSAAESADIRPGDRIVEVQPKKVKIKRALFPPVRVYMQNDASDGKNITAATHINQVCTLIWGVRGLEQISCTHA